jgi:hypothetical protein
MIGKKKGNAMTIQFGPEQERVIDQKPWISLLTLYGTV